MSIFHTSRLPCSIEFLIHNHRHKFAMRMTGKPCGLSQKRLSRQENSCEIHQRLSRLLRNIVGRIHLLCQGFQFPDITGEAAGFLSYPAAMAFSWAFSDSVKGGINKTAVANDANGYWSENSKLVYKASSANAIYGKNSSTQPAVLQTLTIIKW